jgi:hypothetical protein
LLKNTGQAVADNGHAFKVGVDFANRATLTERDAAGRVLKAYACENKRHACALACSLLKKGGKR